MTAAGDAPASPATASPCGECGFSLDGAWHYCPQCGAAQSPEARERERRRRARWYFKPLWIIVLTVTIMGPLTLPLVWKSPEMSRRTKTVLTVFISLFTLFLCWSGYEATVRALELYRDVLEIMHGM